MQIDWWTLGLQAINVLVLIWLLSRFLFRPVAAIVAARQAAIAAALEEARAAAEAAAAQKEAAAAETARLAAARDEALQAAAREAAAEKTTLLAAARTEAGQARAAARDEIARLRQAETAAAADRAGRLAVEIAARLLTRLPERARAADFVDGLADAFAGLPEASRSLIGADGAPLRLRAAGALDEAALRRCRERLADALGRPVEIAVTVDPALIAGLEIETPHAIVRNSLRADLDRIAAALAAGGSTGP